MSEVTVVGIPDVVTFGNVLLDMTVLIENTEILERHGLELDKQGEINLNKLREISAELANGKFAVDHHPGGSALNTSRILQYLNRIKVVFFGAVGSDENGAILEEHLSNCGLEVKLQNVPNYPTGLCFAFVNGNHNSLYANIGASTQLGIGFISKCQESSNFLANDDSKKQIFYIEGMFVPHGIEVCRFIVEQYINQHRIFAFNLSAPYIVHGNQKAIHFMVEYAQLVFGNRNDFLALAESCDLISFEDLIKLFYGRRKKEKMFVITNGSEAVHFYKIAEEAADPKLEHRIFSVDKLPLEEVVDITGAGDAFVAGFLDSYCRGQSIDDCIKEGSRIARLVVTQIGCNLP